MYPDKAPLLGRVTIRHGGIANEVHERLGMAARSGTAVKYLPSVKAYQVELEAGGEVLTIQEEHLRPLKVLSVAHALRHARPRTRHTRVHSYYQ